MLSTIVAIRSAGSDRHPLRADQLARTLSALVPLAVEGLLSEVVLAGAPVSAEQKVVADHSGCGVVEGPDARQALARALQGTAKPLVFVLDAGIVPGDGLVEEIGRAMREDPPDNHALLLREESRALRWPFGRDAVAGIIAPRRLLLAVDAPDFAGLVRVKPARDLRVRGRRVA
jgi:hypothetical protein